MWLWLWPWFWATSEAETTMRAAVIDDARRLAEIHAGGFAVGWSAGEIAQMILAGHNVDVLVSRSLLGEGIIGLAISRVVAGEAELLSITLSAEARGRRLSSGFLHRHAAGLRRAGAETLFLEVAAGNAPALALYRATGFVEIGRRKGYYPAEIGRVRQDALTMRWDISGFDPTPRAYA